MTSYPQWLTLTDSEAEQKELLENQLAREAVQDAYQLLQTFDLEFIIKLACVSGRLHQFFSSALCAPLWQTHLSVFDDPKLGYQASHYQPLDLFQSLNGYCLFSLSIEARQAAAGNKYGDSEMAFLQRSADLKCFRAFDELLRRGLTSFAGSQFISSNPSALLQPALQAAAQHWTPGYLLLFDAYYHLAKRTNNHFYYHEALVALLVAEKLSPLPVSEAASHNAYAGQGLFSRTLAPVTDFKAGHTLLSELGKIGAKEKQDCERKAEQRAESYHPHLQETKSKKTFVLTSNNF